MGGIKSWNFIFIPHCYQCLTLVKNNSISIDAPLYNNLHLSTQFSLTKNQPEGSKKQYECKVLTYQQSVHQRLWYKVRT